MFSFNNLRHLVPSAAPASTWELSPCGYALLSTTLGASLKPRVCSAVFNSPASGLSSSIICVASIYP